MGKIALRRPLSILGAIVVIGCILAWQQDYQITPDYEPSVVQQHEKPALPESKTVVAAGDISCSTQSKTYNNGQGTSDACHMQQTADLARRLHPDTLLLLGDVQYESGSAAEFDQSYSKTWGRPDLKTISRPAAGNHEYTTKNANAYYAYFGSAAGDPSNGYYSYDIGAWHAVVLNSNCSFVACNETSEQYRWLKNDLIAHPAKCVVAYYHHPRFSSGTHGENAAMQPLYELLVANHVDIALAGHDHVYERFGLLNATGQPDVSGIRSFIVGTGGKDHYSFRTVQAGSEARINDVFGVLRLELQPARYRWQYIDEKDTVRDTGSESCR